MRPLFYHNIKLDPLRTGMGPLGLDASHTSCASCLFHACLRLPCSPCPAPSVCCCLCMYYSRKQYPCQPKDQSGSFTHKTTHSASPYSSSAAQCQTVPTESWKLPPCSSFTLTRRCCGIAWSLRISSATVISTP